MSKFLYLIIYLLIHTVLWIMPLDVVAQKQTRLVESTKNLPWIPFRLDEHLLVSLPGAPKLFHRDTTKNSIESNYIANSDGSAYSVIKYELAPSAKAVVNKISTDVFITGLTQSLLTSNQAVRTEQSTFLKDGIEGLRVKFRIPQPKADRIIGGTAWTLLAGNNIYVLQQLLTDSTSVNNLTYEKLLFSSLKVNNQLFTPPTTAEIQPFKIGRFCYVGLSHPTALVERTKSMQIEDEPANNLHLTYDLKWNEDGRGYSITQLSSNGPGKDLFQGRTIHVQITAVEGNTYWFWAELEGFIFTNKMEKVK